MIGISDNNLLYLKTVGKEGGFDFAPVVIRTNQATFIINITSGTENSILKPLRKD